MNIYLKYFFSVLVIVIVMCLISAGGIYFFSPKIGYIKSGVLLNKYKGMEAANAKFQDELKLALTNYDTLKSRYELLMSMNGNIAPAQKKEWQYRLTVAKTELEKYNTQSAEQMELRKQELTKNILDQINKFVEQYAKDNKYDFILGTTDDGSILYAIDKKDLTETVLLKLNEQYEEHQK